MPDRAAIVAGASSGIGLALAETLAAEGHGLTISARKPDTLEAAAESMRNSGYEVEAVAANLADAEAIAGIVARHGGALRTPRRPRQQRGRRRRGGRHGPPDQARRSAARRERARDHPPVPRSDRAAPSCRRRARQRARREPRVSRGQVSPALAVGVLRHEGGRRRLHGGDEQGAQRGRREVGGVRSGIRRHGHERVRQGRHPRRGDAEDERHRRSSSSGPARRSRRRRHDRRMHAARRRSRGHRGSRRRPNRRRRPWRSRAPIRDDAPTRWRAPDSAPSRR
jgi:short chain dehydrogenase